MLLVTFTVNGSNRYVSIDGHALTHNWQPYIMAFESPVLGIPTDHGGYAEMQFGTITFKPDLFYNTVYSWTDYPPPVSGAITIQYTDTDEAAAETIFTGIAHIQHFDREQVTYALYGADYDDKMYVMGVPPLEVGRLYEIVNYVSDDDFTNVGAASNETGVIFTATGTTPTHWEHFSKLAPRWNGSLNSVITDILTQIPEITTVNTDAARLVSPNVTWTLVSDTIAINLAGAIAQFYSHLIYVVGSTAYLVDMLRDNGTRTLTEFQFFAFPRYEYKAPYAQINCSYGGVVYNVTSSYPYGPTTSVDPYHQTAANIEAALDDILTLENSPRTSFDVPMIAGNFPALGEKITLPDTAHVAAITSWIRARRLRFDFFNDSINIEGEGAISAA